MWRNTKESKRRIAAAFANVTFVRRDTAPEIEKLQTNVSSFRRVDA